MISSRFINIVTALAVVLALVLSFMLVAFADGSTVKDTVMTAPEYAQKLFVDGIMSVEIIANESDWQSMLDNAMSEEYIMVDVVVNGKKFSNVGIRPKGNSSLSQVASSDSDRYSFRLKFDEYVKGQTCFGLQSFVLNNMVGDYTYMKEYVSYELMREIGVDAPYFGFAQIKLNGAEWGLYLAVEAYGDAYEQRVSGDTSGMLYNVKMSMGGNKDFDIRGGNPVEMFEFNAGDGQIKGQMAIENAPAGPPAQGAPGGQAPGGQGRPGRGQPPVNGGGFPLPQDTPPQDTPPQETPPQETPPQETPPQDGVVRDQVIAIGGNSGGGGSLEYTDDSVDSYASIFENAVGKSSDKDNKRIIEALKALSEGRDLETYFDVDQILRYLAAHTVTVNLDSYSSGMAQNYYIYERGGKLSILPWDYNLAWGGFQTGDASSMVNFPIDTPVSGVTMEQRPLIDKLLSNPEYLERYHTYLKELMDRYFADGKFEKKINKLSTLIDTYVQSDPTKFCTYEQYKSSLDTFVKVGNLRAESINGQLDGSVPSTTEQQGKNPDKLISADGIDISSLGSMMGGMRGNPPGGNPPGGNPLGGGMPDREIMEKAMALLAEANGEITDEIREKLIDVGINEEQLSLLEGIVSNKGEGMFVQGNFGGGPVFAVVSPDGMAQQLGKRASTWEGAAVIGTCLCVMIAAIVLVRLRRRNY